MESFVHDQSAVRVLFGAGAVTHIKEEVQRLGANRALLITSSGRVADAGKISELLGSNAAGVFADAVTHVPFDAVNAAAEAARKDQADSCIAIGGGSTIGIGKAIAHRTGLPIIAIPTTYAGSEMTPVYGITRNGIKKTERDRNVLPKTVIYDPTLTLKVPAKVAGASGMNALAHCLAAIMDEESSPVIRMIATEGMRALKQALPIVVTRPENLDARADALYGAWMSGTALAGSRMNIHYKLCHAIGAAFDLPHAEVHAVVLPHSAAFNLGLTQGQELYDFAVLVGAPTALKDIGMPEEGIDYAAKLATETAAYNPRPVDHDSIKQLVRDAYVGARPK